MTASRRLDTFISSREPDQVPKKRANDADERPWLVIDPAMERAILTALLRRYGSTLTMKVSELEATLDVKWGLEGFRSSEDPGTVHLRLRRLD